MWQLLENILCYSDLKESKYSFFHEREREREKHHEREALMIHQIKNKLGKPIKRDKLNIRHVGV